MLERYAVRVLLMIQRIKMLEIILRKSMSFEIASSNNSLGLLRKFSSLDEFVIFYKNFIMEQIDLIHLPLKIGSQRLSKLLRYRIFIFKNIAIQFHVKSSHAMLRIKTFCFSLYKLIFQALFIILTKS